MSLISFGVNHNTASLEYREKMTRCIQQESMMTLLKHPSVEESVVLSTCNRVEIYVVLNENATEEMFLKIFETEGILDFLEHGYLHRGLDVVQHLFRVVSSLDSMILGENQILSQSRNAFSYAEQQGSVGPILRRLFQRGFKLAKEAHSQTAISEGSVSIGRAGVELAQQVLGDLTTVTALIVGAGEHGQLVANNMKNQGLSKIVVANRTMARAEELAQQMGGDAIRLNSIASVLSKVDVVISSVGGGETLITKDTVVVAMRSRRYKPLVFIDLSVPRVFDLALHEIDDVYLFDVDDLKGLTDHGENLRRSEAIKVEEMVFIEAANCWRILHADQHNRTIGQVFQNASQVCKRELDRIQGQTSFSEEQVLVVQRAFDSLVKKLYHHPIQHIHSLANENKLNEIQDVINILLGCEIEEHEEH